MILFSEYTCQASKRPLPISKPPVQNVVARDRRPETIQTWERLTAGGCAGVTAATFTYPLDLARTRLSLATDPSAPQGVLAILRGVYKHEGGILALYRGLSPTLMVQEYPQEFVQANSIY